MRIAPNLTIIVWELEAVRLIYHAGSLISLAKIPVSTIQKFGAEKVFLDLWEQNMKLLNMF